MIVIRGVISDEHYKRQKCILRTCQRVSLYIITGLNSLILYVLFFWHFQLIAVIICVSSQLPEDCMHGQQKNNAPTRKSLYANWSKVCTELSFVKWIITDTEDKRELQKRLSGRNLIIFFWQIMDCKGMTFLYRCSVRGKQDRGGSQMGILLLK